MNTTNLVLILIIALILIIMCDKREKFNICYPYDKCSKYNNKSYSKCLDNGNCATMVDLMGNTFCTSKNT